MRHPERFRLALASPGSWGSYLIQICRGLRNSWGRREKQYVWVPPCPEVVLHSWQESFTLGHLTKPVWSTFLVLKQTDRNVNFQGEKTGITWLTGSRSSCCSPGWSAVPPGSGSTAPAPGHPRPRTACGGRWSLAAGRHPAGRELGTGGALPWCRIQRPPAPLGSGAHLVGEDLKRWWFFSRVHENTQQDVKGPIWMTFGLGSSYQHLSPGSCGCLCICTLSWDELNTECQVGESRNGVRQ